MRGHAAWNAWPWKLHRIQNDSTIEVEHYNLANESQHAAAMKEELQAWQRSVLVSWSGKDYVHTEKIP